MLHFVKPLALSLLLVSPVSAIAQEILPPSISVSGEGRVTAAPDMGHIQLGVRRQAATAAGAMSAANQAAAAVLAEVTARGIEERDVQTTRIGLNPVWEHRQNQPAKVVGYEAVNDLAIRVRDLDDMGTLLDALVNEGANTVQGISFAIDDSDTLRSEARLAAIKDARAKAETLAEGAGVALGGVRAVSELGAGRPQPMMRQMNMAAADSMESSVPIAAGEMEIAVRVQAVWDIAQD